jgi:DNA replication protein DnaC
MKFNFNSETKPCPDCGAPVETINGWALRCEPCGRKAEISYEAALKEKQRKERWAEWGKICPPIFLETEKARIPDQRALTQVMDWKFNPKGLFAVGPTRTGKTRSIWLLLHRLFMEENINIEAISVVRFSRDLTNSFHKEGEYYRLLDRLCKAPVLFLDDLGKERMTERLETELFAILDERIQWKRPVLITTNYRGEDLKARFTDEANGDPFLFRLREFCDPILFKHQPVN